MAGTVNTKMHTDIKPDGWVMKVLPPFSRPYAALARLDRPAGTWLLLLPGWWAIVLASGGIAAMGGREWALFALFGIGAVAMRGAGCVVNDLWDRDLDKKVERTRLRPLASGAVNVRQALVFLIVLLCIGLAVLLQMNFLTVALGVLSLPLVAVYPLMKRFTWWPQLFLGVVFNFGALMGWSAVTGGIALPALLLYAGGIFWTLGYDTIYAHQDKEDDALAGIKSTALKFGSRSKSWVWVFFIAAWVLIAQAAITVDSADNIVRGFLFMAMAGVTVRQMQRWNPADPASSLRAFRESRFFGFITVLALGV